MKEQDSGTLSFPSTISQWDGTLDTPFARYSCMLPHPTPGQLSRCLAEQTPVPQTRIHADPLSSSGIFVPSVQCWLQLHGALEAHETFNFPDGMKHPCSPGMAHKDKT